MIKRSLLCLLLTLALQACSRGAEVRYRVSFDVNDNGVTQSASGVWSTAISPSALPLVSRYRSKFEGEAIPLVLPGRGILLVLPVGQPGEGDAGGIVRLLFQHRAKARDSDRVRSTAEIARMVGQSRRMRCAHYAIPGSGLEPGEVFSNRCLAFLFTADPRDESALQRVRVVGGRFQGLPRVRITDARVTITRAPVTRGLVNLLPWLPSAEAYWSGQLVSSDDIHLGREIGYLRS